MSERDALAAHPELAALVRLRDAGWKFIAVPDEHGRPAEHDGVRAWPGGWVDGIRITSSTNVLGIRVSPDEPPAITWDRTGTLEQVVNALLELPAPGDRFAPRFARGSASGLWLPRS